MVSSVADPDCKYPEFYLGQSQGCGTEKFEDGSGSDVLYEYGSGSGSGSGSNSGSGSYTYIYIYEYVYIYVYIFANVYVNTY
jgi:hypothetical protein